MGQHPRTGNQPDPLRAAEPRPDPDESGAPDAFTDGAPAYGWQHPGFLDWLAAELRREPEAAASFGPTLAESGRAMQARAVARALGVIRLETVEPGRPGLPLQVRPTVVPAGFVGFADGEYFAIQLPDVGADCAPLAHPGDTLVVERLRANDIRGGVVLLRRAAGVTCRVRRDGVLHPLPLSSAADECAVHDSELLGEVVAVLSA